jgi:hypothetical protein
MPESDDGACWEPLSERSWDERDVIVVNEHDGGYASRLLCHGVSKLCVHGLVHVEVGASKHGLHGDRVAQRPEALVGEAVIVAAVCVLIELNVSQPISRLPGRHVQPTAIVDHERVGGAGSMCHPYSGIRLNERLEGCHKPACRAARDDLLLSVTLVSEGGTVCQDDHATWSWRGRGAESCDASDGTFTRIRVN